LTTLTPDHINSWRQDGVIVIEKFFDKDEMEPILRDYQRLYGKTGKEKANLADFSKQFEIIDVLPYSGSLDLNLISLHPSLIKAAMGKIHRFF
jgi:hypothetical protein